MGDYAGSIVGEEVARLRIKELEAENAWLRKENKIISKEYGRQQEDFEAVVGEDFEILEALRKDKERLDWLLGNHNIKFLDTGPSSKRTFLDTRQDIDRAMGEGE